MSELNIDSVKLKGIKLPTVLASLSVICPVSDKLKSNQKFLDEMINFVNSVKLGRF